MNDVSAPREAGSPANTSDLFQIMRDGQARTRSELSALTGLARSTVALRVDALMKLGLLRPVNDAISTGGRPSTQFALNSTGHSVLAVDVGASHVRVATTDLGGAVIAEELEELDIASGPTVVVDRVKAIGWAPVA